MGMIRNSITGWHYRNILFTTSLFVSYSAHWSIQQFRGHAGIGRNIGPVGERKGEFLSFLFISGSKGREEILDVPWRVDVSSLLPCREDLVLIRHICPRLQFRARTRGWLERHDLLLPSHWLIFFCSRESSNSFLRSLTPFFIIIWKSFRCKR